jgi:hypothetical protein
MTGAKLGGIKYLTAQAPPRRSGSAMPDRQETFQERIPKEMITSQLRQPCQGGQEGLSRHWGFNLPRCFDECERHKK